MSDKKGFLVLTVGLKKGFTIDDDIYISINKIKKNGEVSISIKAPREYKVRLDEKEKKVDENKD